MTGTPPMVMECDGPTAGSSASPTTIRSASAPSTDTSRMRMVESTITRMTGVESTCSPSITACSTAPAGAARRREDESRRRKGFMHIVYRTSPETAGSA